MMNIVHFRVSSPRVAVHPDFADFTIRAPILARTRRPNWLDRARYRFRLALIGTARLRRLEFPPAVQVDF